MIIGTPSTILANVREPCLRNEKPTSSAISVGATTIIRCARGRRPARSSHKRKTGETFPQFRRNPIACSLVGIPGRRQEEPIVAQAITTLQELREAEARCTRCTLHRDATQVVPGEGSARARIMFIGEQPGNDEDLKGRPFVGPAGRVFDKALAEVGLDRSKVFVTNAVKHFKFEQRGKRRLHKRPNAYEIERCRWWNDLERAIVRPDIIVALGASAARSLLGRTVTISRVRGEVLTSPAGLRMLVTIHPSLLLRLQDDESKTREYRRFVDDLRKCQDAVRAAA